ncbi:hypothetical protein JOB18_024093%2C partial [Xyrichtys novacula]|uniref:Uncharacterized protein n=1 Tax=Xyrichtys novacula TaxID=13765 RepID=A0AAV1EXG9_XYRNO|nr:hypothetical protein JOB18_024093%2C partial [Xyrichtys novacula]
MSSAPSKEGGRTTRAAKEGKESTSGANANASKEANTSLDPATAKAFKAMTDQLTKVIDAKMSLLVESVQKVVSGLQTVEKRLDEVEERVDTVETATISCNGCVLQLEKQLKDPIERLDSYKDRHRRLRDRRIVNKSHKRLFNLLTYATRKNVLLSWIDEKPPTKKGWYKIIMQCMPLEFLTCLLRSTTDNVYKI